MLEFSQRTIFHGIIIIYTSSNSRCIDVVAIVVVVLAAAVQQ